MKAKVKKIKVGKILDVDEHKDSFEDRMLSMARSGRVFKFKPYPFTTKWFMCTDYGYEFNFHLSWLKEIKK
jgi:hypothetical protein